MMNRKLEEYYEARFEMFTTKGWKDFVEDLQEVVESAKNLDSIHNEQQLWFKKGQLDILQWLTTMPAITEEVYKNLKDGEDEVHA